MSLIVPLDEIFAEKTGLLANHESWKRIELGKVCNILNGFPFKSALFNNKKGFPIIRIRDLCKGATETLYDGEVPKEFVVKERDLLIGMDGNFRCWEWQGGEAGLNQRVCKIVPDEKYLDRNFLLFGLNGYLRAIEDATSSVTVGHLSSLDILRIPFPLPPVAEQRRIAAKLQALLARVDACQQRLTGIPALLKRFRNSVLEAACSGRLTTAWRADHGCGQEDWSEVQLGELLAEPLANGRSVPDGINGFPVLRLTCLRNGRIDLNERKIGAWDAEAGRRFSVAKGDFFVSRGNGSLALVGRGGLVEDMPDPVAFPDTMIRIRVRQSIVSAGFLQRVWDAKPTRDQIESAAHTTAGIWKISQGDLEQFVLPVPPIEEQQEIVRQTKALFALADRIEARYREGRRRVDSLARSVLGKAFCGELVPTEAELARVEGRSFESAEELLERIKQKEADAGRPPKIADRAQSRPRRRRAVAGR